MIDLFEMLNQVVDEVSFVSFIEMLGTDFSVNKEDWNNIEINDFFECAAEWAHVSKDGLEFYKRSNNPWRRAADIIYMGKIYE